MSRGLNRPGLPLAVLIIVLGINFAALASSGTWTDFVAYTGFRAEYFREDFLRSSPTWSSHVRLHFMFQNVGTDEITGIEFKARFLDGFGDTLQEDEFKYHVRLSPGDVSPDNRYWYFEEPILPTDRSPFTKLKGPAMGGTLRAEVAVTRIAFADETVWVSPEEIWSRPAPPVPEQPTANLVVPELLATTLRAEPRLEIHLLERNGRIEILDDAWHPVPYPVTARVTNVGDADAENVVVRFESHLLELAEGDIAAKPLGRIPAGSSAEATWHVQPQTVSSTQSNPYIGNLAYTVKGIIGGDSEEYRADGFVDVPPLLSSIRLEISESGPFVVGDSIRVQVVARNLRRFYGAEIAVEYDPSRLELVGETLGVSPGSLFLGDEKADLRLLTWHRPVHEVAPDGTRATLRFGGDRRGATRPTLFLASGTLATLHFRALTPGEHEIRLMSPGTRISDEHGQSVGVDRLSGAVVTVIDR